RRAPRGLPRASRRGGGPLRPGGGPEGLPPPVGWARARGGGGRRRPADALEPGEHGPRRAAAPRPRGADRRSVLERPPPRRPGRLRSDRLGGRLTIPLLGGPAKRASRPGARVTIAA